MNSIKYKSMDEVPEPEEPIRYVKPIFPTYSRGCVGSVGYNNNKYHCYGVVHSKPVYNFTPYRATGFGYADRNRSYIPLTHVVDRSRPKPKKLVNEKSVIKLIYENGMDLVKANAARREAERLRWDVEDAEIRNIERNYSDLISKMRYEIHDLTNNTDEMIGDTRYRAHQINRLVRDNHDLMQHNLYI